MMILTILIKYILGVDTFSNTFGQILKSLTLTKPIIVG
jgi:hypothetical protein